jgi:type IV pilus assembly protein PilX
MKQSGFILFITLIFTLLISILGISMMKSFGTLEEISGSFREKSRANEAAQSAIYYAEWWLLSSSQSAAVNAACASTPLATTPSTSPIICSNPLLNTGSVFDPNITYISDSTTAGMVNPWSAYNIYIPLNMNSNTAGGVDSNKMSNYFRYPIFYIQKLGTPSVTSKSGSTYYLITAMGFGGNKNDISVIQSVYALTSGYGTDVTGQ